MTSPSVDRALTDRLAASADAWKRKLLDLTRRNRALNFRINKVSTITIVDEHPAEVFRQLYLKEHALKFKAAPDDGTAAEAAIGEEPSDNREVPRSVVVSDVDGAQVRLSVSVVGAEEAADVADDEDDGALEADFVPYDPVSLAERHTDQWLQTASKPDALDRSLRRIDEQARASLEEQGVNTLFLSLGMLHYTEATDSDVVFKAPLVLLPVELERKSARSGFTIKAADDEPMVNPALAEYLRRDHAIVIPAIPDSNAIGDDYDLQTLLTALSAAIAPKKGWAVKTDIYLSLLSFQKFVMYKDLEANEEALKDHRLIRQLVGRDGGQIAGLPPEIREMDLDTDYTPETTFQVVDADSSQLRAIAAAARNYDLVIEGPPGTGKSQTITNVIAQALSVGKSVLFVAEKMAALSVVYDRLVRAGLGEFCLELHSTKANKRTVMKEIGATIDASLQSVAGSAASTQRLPAVRATLTDYANAVHDPYSALNLSPYRVYGEYAKVANAPRVAYAGPVVTATREQLDEALRALSDLVAAASEIGRPVSHPWHGATKTFYASDDLDDVRELASDIVTRLADIRAQSARLAAAFGLPPVIRLVDVGAASRIAEVVARSPGAPVDVLANPAWNEPPADATRLVERGRALNALRARIETNFTEDVFAQEHAPDIAYAERKTAGMFSFLAVLDGRYRALKKRWMAYRKPGYRATVAEQAAEMKHVDRYRAERVAFEQLDEKAHGLFGNLWKGEHSTWDVLDGYVRWVVEFRAVCVQHKLADQAIQTAAKRAPDLTDVTALQRVADEAAPAIARLASMVGWPADLFDGSSIDGIESRVAAIGTHATLGPQWAAFELARRSVQESLAAELLPALMTGDLAFSDAAPAFLRAVYSRWLADVVQSRGTLERFHTLTHEERVAEFRKLDERVLLENRAALVGRLRDRAQNALRSPDIAGQMPYLRRELAKQRALSPLRRTMQQAGSAVRAIKPCMMMSPLTVAQLLDGGSASFDLIIFDEASQLPAEDAVGAIIRGKQLVVVGDPKQLPPTSFFSVTSGTANVAVDEEGQPLVDDTESILEEFMGAGVPMSRLKWHYRSAHESLISFSNVQFYDSDLYTFPSVETGSLTHGLQFEYLSEGVYEGKGLNIVEARRVADEVVRFAREQLDLKARGEPTQSLGVGTFNMRQQLAIQDELERRRREDPSIEPFFNRGTGEPFFVKNLENIQGDERDVIFISVTYAKAADGRLRYNFGPINGENGWRRLNVLTTRARQRMRVFSSMRGDEINAAGTTSRGAALLREFLIFAERGRLESVSANLAAETESPFEREVVQELTNRGVKVIPQVGVAGYRIDIGVLDDSLPGRFLCGIECDGVAYHSSETARDRDRLRQQVLEARGWTMHRVWSTDWFKDRAGQISRLMGFINDARNKTAADLDADRRARERVAQEAAARAQQEAEEMQRALAALQTASTEYTRPSGAAYTMASGQGAYSGQDLLEAPTTRLVHAITSVIEMESPLHESDLFLRVAGKWDTRVGSRIQARLREACSAAEAAGYVRRRGEFLWTKSDACVVRSRTGTRIPGERIASEEYQEAIRMVLRGGHGFSRPQLVNEVRSVLGYSRTGAMLEEAIEGAIDALLRSGSVGEGSLGIRLRT